MAAHRAHQRRFTRLGLETARQLAWGNDAAGYDFAVVALRVGTK